MRPAASSAGRRAAPARAWTRRAMPRRPSGPWYTAYMRGHHGEKDLGGADVRRRLLAADVLLAGLEGQAVGGPALRVDREPDEPARQVPLEAGPDRHERRVRPAVPERHAEALGGADRHVGAPLPRRLQQRQGEQVGGHGHQRAALVGLRGQGGEVADGTRAAGVLLHHAEELAGGQAGVEVGHHHLEAERAQAGLEHGQGLGQAVRVDHDPVRLAPWSGGA